MKKLVAAMVAFALPAILAAWLALAPIGGALARLDPLAEAVAGFRGRSAAVTALLMAGIGLAILSALAVRRRQPDASDKDDRQPRRAFENANRGKAEAFSEDRLARQYGDLAEGDGAPGASETAPLPEAASPSSPAPLADAQPVRSATPPPVTLVRAARHRERDWFGDPSWFGGLPRLGGAPWPRDDAGVPLPFAAQIDLSEIAAACPDSLLPPGGSLAFFLGAGAVIPVPVGASDFSDPPADLPPAYEEGGQPFPARSGRLTRWFFPFWPVTPVASEQVAQHAIARDHPFYAAGVGAPVEQLWWHSIIHLADQLHEAHDASGRLLAGRRDALAHQEAALARLRIDAGAVPYAVEDAVELLEQAEAEFAVLQDQCAALPDMIGALDHFVEGRDPWSPLAPEEIGIVGDILGEVHERYGDAVRDHAPGTLATLATISARAMVSGPAEALTALPRAVLSRINGEYRLPPVHPHTMLGTDAEGLLLLQLGYDDLMEWRWDENAVFRFRISPQDAAAGRWNTARLSFEIL